MESADSKLWRYCASCRLELRTLITITTESFRQLNTRVSHTSAFFLIMSSRRRNKKMNQPEVSCVYHKETGTACYIAACPRTKLCAIIDPVLDYSPVAHKVSTSHASKVIELVEENQYQPVYIIETHVHADHLTGAQALKKRFPEAKTVIGFNVAQIQRTFADMLNLEIPCDGSQFDKLMQDGEEYTIGDLACRALWTPGHTPACMTHIIGDAVFSGDTIFMPDFGTARCDFPGGSAEALYESIQKVFQLPAHYRLFVGHDYGLDSRAAAWETTVAVSRQSNKQVSEGTSKEEFVAWRKNRDAGLPLPALIMQSLQVNLRNGMLPPPESDGNSYLKVPVSFA